jgi:uncharacterized protein YbjT (DUF2867 family)
VLGSLVAAELAARGDEVRGLSRSPGSGELPGGTPHLEVDLRTGAGLGEALTGCQVVVDASNSRKQAREVLVAGTGRLLRAGAEAGVRHHVAISIVGCDRVPIAYYETKVEQERAVEVGPLPWSLLRATQFHTLIDWLFASTARFGVVPTGAARLQPLDPATVARAVAEAVHREASGRLPDLAGPEVRTLGELARIWRRVRGRRVLPLRVPSFGAAGRAMRDGGLCNAEAAVESRTFEQWLADE